MPDKNYIICKHCGQEYGANKRNRTHCRKTACRNKEIEYQVKELQDLFNMLTNNRIEATVEIRLAGNDKISPEAKVDSVTNLNNDIVTEKKVSFNKSNIVLSKLGSYFKKLLWKGVKGNFIIKTNTDGLIDSRIFNQTFLLIAKPIIIGNNLLIHYEKKVGRN